MAIASSRGLEPLLAVYHRKALPVLTSQLDGGERRLSRLLERLPTVAVGEDAWRTVDPHARSLVNLNEPADVVGQP